ncbi:MAG: nitroreductase family protein [Candidatus Thermoplasmatota archaeon]
MDTNNCIARRRSIRRFKNRPIEIDKLKKMVEAARLAPSAANLQPLRYCIVHKKELCRQIFETLRWAGYLKDWSPSKDEQPTAYIVILVADTDNKWYSYDVGLAAENIMLSAENIDIGSCILGSVDREKVKKILDVPDRYKIDSVIALGYKDEECMVEDMEDNSVEYWRDEEDILHVPKRKLSDIMFIDEF